MSTIVSAENMNVEVEIRSRVESDCMMSASVQHVVRENSIPRSLNVRVNVPQSRYVNAVALRNATAIAIKLLHNATVKRPLTHKYRGRDRLRENR